MKLEEVLPFMRSGRIAMCDGYRFRWSEAGGFERDYKHCDQWTTFIGNLPMDFWTLEPEPRVEWPKGSLQWAETEANRLGLTYIKRRNFHLSTPVVDLRHHIFSDDARHALDWEVVP